MATVTQVLRLPRGKDLPEEAWRQRHLVVAGVLWAHIPFVLGWVLLDEVSGTHATHSQVGHSAMFVFGLLLALAATGLGGLAWVARSKRDRMVAATIGLLCCSAAIVHLGHGDVVWHFHFFVVVALVSLYQSWRPYASALGFVVLHHLIMALVEPSTVFAGSALHNPFTATLIHGSFILAASAAGLLSWSWNEQLQDSVTRAAEEFGSAFDHAPIGMTLVSPAGRFQRVNSALCSILGREPDELMRLTFQELTHPDDLTHDRGFVQETLDGTRDGYQLRKRYLHADGRTIWAQLTVRLVRDAEGVPEHFIAHVEDITERKAFDDRLQYQATHDPLTGLPNRQLLFERLHEVQSTGGTSAVVFIDLDSFKAVNDSHGHAAGDLVLLETGRRLSHLLGDRDLVARVGGDEFVVMAPELDLPGARQLAERVRRVLHQPFVVEGGLVARVSASVGVALGGPQDDVGEVLRDADAAMYEAKGGGKDRTAVADAQLHERVEVDRRVVRLLQDPAAHLEVHYQPIVDAATGLVVGDEALARLRDDGALIPPDRFIPVAEREGLIMAMGDHVLDVACRHAARRLAAQVQSGGRQLATSVNVTARQVAGARFADHVLRTAAAAGLPTGLLTLELTESALLDADETALTQLVALREAGVGIAIDDFGTGYASLSYLLRLPVSCIKIDREFVAGLPHDRSSLAVTRSVVQLANDLGLSVVAEGVETQVQRDVLVDLGVPLLQGFLFGRPVADAHAPRVPAPRSSKALRAV
jgi:diguanylate cyclase (GGDEF)-like protein/PAS domain S-box-containing protein